MAGYLADSLFISSRFISSFYVAFNSKTAACLAASLAGLKLETIIGSGRRRLSRLFKLAEISNGHPHRFRDTFAVELLLTGVPIERVSILLGHESVRTTERNYAPWVRSRQEQLEADLTRAWQLDPVIAAQTSQTRGTRQVHGKKRRSKSQILKRENWRRGWDSNPRMEVLQTSRGFLSCWFVLPLRPRT